MEFLLYSSIACSDATEMLQKIASHEQLSEHVKVELVETIQEATPHCP